MHLDERRCRDSLSLNSHALTQFYGSKFKYPFSNSFVFISRKTGRRVVVVTFYSWEIRMLSQDKDDITT